MENFCPYCETVTTINKANKIVEYDIRGEKIPVEFEILVCNEGHEFEDPESEYDSIDVAYRIYRDKFGMLQPEEIKEIRNTYGLTQQELADLLGWGYATLSRYENGALQSEANDLLLKLIRDPDNVMSILLDKKTKLPSDFVEKLENRVIRPSKNRKALLKAVFEKRYSNIEVSDCSGFMQFGFDKLINMILFFVKDSEVYKTKLNKLLFYADFKHFKENFISITGSQYAHLTYGPILDEYQLILGILSEEGYIELKEESIGECIGELVWAKRKPDLGVFSNEEIRTMITINEYFKDFSSRSISEISHQEDAYRNTKEGELIPYTYAETLSI